MSTIQSRAEPPKLIVTIVVDQMRYDYLERFRDEFSRHGFRLLTDRGAFMTSAAYDYCPTVTAPGHASYLSGTPPSIHGIIGNDWFDRQKRRSIGAVSDSAYQGVGTTSTNIQVSPRHFIGSNFADQLRLHFGSKVIGISMKDRAAVLPAGKRPNGAYWFETSTGHFISSTYYMKELPEWLQKFNAQEPAERFRGTNWTRLLPADRYQNPDAGVAEGHLDGETNNVFPHVVHYTEKDKFKGLLPTPFGNDLLASLARAAIEGEDLGEGSVPDLLCISFSSLDACGHTFGPYSQEVQDVVLRLDLTLEELFKYLDQHLGLKNVQIVLTADHGVAPLPEFAHEQGLDGGRVNESELMKSLVDHLSAAFGTGDLFLSHSFHYGNLYYDFDKLKQRRITASELSTEIREWAFSTGKIESVYPRDQLLGGQVKDMIGSRVLRGYNPERSGDIVVVYKPFLIPSSGKTGTTHGTPYSYDAHVPMLFYGTAFKPGRYADPFSITDIVPTLCAELHVEPPAGCIGHAFTPMLTGK